MNGADAQCTRRGKVAGPASGVLKWKAKLGGLLDIGGLVDACAVAKDGTAFTTIGSFSLLAISPTGRKLWVSGGLPIGSGSHVTSLVHMGDPASVVIGPDGTLYLGGAAGMFYAFDQTGKQLWAEHVDNHPSSSTDRPFCISPTLGDDGLLRAAYDHTLYALDTQGKVQWQLELKGEVEHAVAVAKDGTSYVVSWEDGLVNAVDNRGQLKWTFPIGEHARGGCSVGSDGTVYACAPADGKIYALAPDGKPRWTAQTDGSFDNGPCLGPDDTVYDAGYDSKLYAIARDGQTKWSTSFGTSGTDIPFQPICDANGQVFVATSGAQGSKLTAINPDGSINWDTNNIGRLADLHVEPVLTDQGDLLIGDSAGTMYCLGN